MRRAVSAVKSPSGGNRRTVFLLVIQRAAAGEVAGGGGITWYGCIDGGRGLSNTVLQRRESSLNSPVGGGSWPGFDGCGVDQAGSFGDLPVGQPAWAEARQQGSAVDVAGDVERGAVGADEVQAAGRLVQHAGLVGLEAGVGGEGSGPPFG